MRAVVIYRVIHDSKLRHRRPSTHAARPESHLIDVGWPPGNFTMPIGRGIQ